MGKRTAIALIVLSAAAVHVADVAASGPHARHPAVPFHAAKVAIRSHWRRVEFQITMGPCTRRAGSIVCLDALRAVGNCSATACPRSWILGLDTVRRRGGQLRVSSGPHQLVSYAPPTTLPAVFWSQLLAGCQNANRTRSRT